MLFLLHYFSTQFILINLWQIFRDMFYFLFLQLNVWAWPVWKDVYVAKADFYTRIAGGVNIHCAYLQSALSNI